MAVTKKYTEPLQAVLTFEQREQIREIAEREKISQARVVRDCIDMALDARVARGRPYKLPSPTMTRKYADPLQVIARPEQFDTIRDVAEREEISRAHVIRDCVDMALKTRAEGRTTKIPRR
jgi:hypothetical protein